MRYKVAAEHNKRDTNSVTEKDQQTVPKRETKQSPPKKKYRHKQIDIGERRDEISALASKEAIK